MLFHRTSNKIASEQLFNVADVLHITNQIHIDPWWYDTVLNRDRDSFRFRRIHFAIVTIFAMIYFESVIQIHNYIQSKCNSNFILIGLCVHPFKAWQKKIIFSRNLKLWLKMVLISHNLWNNINTTTYRIFYLARLIKTFIMLVWCISHTYLYVPCRF